MSRNGQPRSIVRRLIFNLAVTIGLLLGALVASLIISAVVLSNQRNLDTMRFDLTNASTNLLQAMLNQETGLRGYINNLDNSFLEPFNQGRSDYTDTLHRLQNLTLDQKLDNTAQALREADQRANDWYNNFANPQIERIRQGLVNDARNPDAEREGKSRFDNFRGSVSRLNQAIERDLTRIEQDNNTFQTALLVVITLVVLIALFFIWRTSSQFVRTLRGELTELMDVTDRLEEGDLAARITTPANDELGRLGQNFNNMANALQEQQFILKERDIQSNVLQISATLNSSLELEALLEQFLKQLLQLLNLQVGAVYLYNRETNLLNLAAVQGLDRSKMTLNFQPGEGVVGQVAQIRKPIVLERPSLDEVTAAEFTLKTIYGEVLPANLYHQPLLLGTELIGVLVSGAMYPMSESARNVISVVSAGLSSAISNAQAYRHIQTQAEELERRRSELERGNQQLSRQRDELKVLNSALEEANRLRNQFLSTMSHELRTPLTAIIGFSQLSLRSAETNNLNKRQRANLEHILRNGQHLLTLVNDVLDIAKIEAGRVDITRSQLQLEELFKDVVEETQSLWQPKKLKVTYEVEPTANFLESDPDRLHQILLNLLGNAIKFTDAGSITLKAEMRQSTLDQASDQGEVVAISVSDTGIGIDPGVQEHIFEEFYQADGTTTRKYGGTGLGLSIVRKLTDLLGGRVELQSIPGSGSTFIIILPRRLRNRPNPEPEYLLFNRAEPAIIQPKPASEPLAEQEQQIVNDKRLVLAVDDDPDILTLIRGTLEDSDYQVIGLLDARKVLETVRRLRPYAVTLDVMMPEMNGWQILQQLKSDPVTAGIPVIMLTVVSDRSAGYVLGASEYLIKPVERPVLLKTLDRLAQRRIAQVQAVTLNGDGSSNQIIEENRTPNGSVPQERAYILVIDDDPDVRMLLEDTMVEAGYQVKTAAGGQEGLKLAQEERPGMILLDLMMPGMDGFEVLERLRADPRTISIPVVVQTAKTLTDQEREFLKQSATRIIQKGSIPLERLAGELNGLIKKG
jgi:signal transduction histidine kinase/DNA-binding response OmpR family regulator/CHASE3 domain sensor protein